MTDQIASPASVRAKYDSAMFRMLAEVWENHFHMGWFEARDETLGTAGARATAMMAEACAPASGSTVLEVACGTGATARALAERFGARVVATNLSTSQIEQGRAALADAPGRDRISFAVADYHALPFAGGAFDVWWCQEALLYSTDRDRVFAEARRVVRPGGRLVVSDLLVTGSIAASALDELARMISAPGFWTAERYEAFFVAAGFEVLARRDGAPHVAATFSCVLDRLRARSEEFAARLGSAEPVIAAERRVELQLRRAREGHLGWSWWVLNR